MGSQVQDEFTVLVTGFQVCVTAAISPHSTFRTMLTVLLPAFPG
jgi:hypothetical protein